MRVLALTADAMLQVALASMMPSWEVQALNDASDALDADGVAVALVDLGSTERGLEAASALAYGLRLPCVVIGDELPPDDACARVVLRPFTLSDLADAVVRASEEGPRIVEPPEAFLQHLEQDADEVGAEHTADEQWAAEAPVDPSADDEAADPPPLTAMPAALAVEDETTRELAVAEDQPAIAPPPAGTLSDLPTDELVAGAEDAHEHEAPDAVPVIGEAEGADAEVAAPAVATVEGAAEASPTEQFEELSDPAPAAELEPEPEARPVSRWKRRRDKAREIAAPEPEPADAPSAPEPPRADPLTAALASLSSIVKEDAPTEPMRILEPEAAARASDAPEEPEVEAEPPAGPAAGTVEPVEEETRSVASVDRLDALGDLDDGSDDIDEDDDGVVAVVGAEEEDGVASGARQWVLEPLDDVDLRELASALRDYKDPGEQPKPKPKKKRAAEPVAAPDAAAPEPDADRPSVSEAPPTPAPAAPVTPAPVEPAIEAPVVPIRPAAATPDPGADPAVFNPAAVAPAPKPAPEPARVVAMLAADPTPTKTVEYVRSLLAELDVGSDPVPSLAAPKVGARIVRERLPRPAPQREIVPGGEEPSFRRRLLRRSSVVTQPTQPQHEPGSIVSRIAVAVWAARDLEALLHEMPVLSEPRTVARTFLGQVVELFGPETAAVYALQPDGDYKVVAPHGLSQTEVDRRVPATQSLFRDLATSGNGVFISPVDLAQGLVVGIGGARTESLMAAPLDAAGSCVGIVVVGGRDLQEPHLGRLCEMAAEAAPGLAFALMIERLRNRLA